MQSSPEPSGLTDAFERIVHGLPHQREFSGIEIVTTRTRRNRDGLALSVMVDNIGKSTGVDIATCERVAARITLRSMRLANRTRSRSSRPVWTGRW